MLESNRSIIPSALLLSKWTKNIPSTLPDNIRSMAACSSLLGLVSGPLSRTVVRFLVYTDGEDRAGFAFPVKYGIVLK